MYCEIQIDSDLLVDALEKSGMTARMHNFNHDGENLLAIVQVRGGDVEVFETTLNQDSLLDTWSQVHATENVYEYRVTYSRDENVAGYERVFSNSGILNQAIFREDWNLHMFFPNQEELVSYEQELEKLGFQPTTECILQSGTHKASNLTEKQREILYLARERGYFAIPRSVTLSELSDELDISTVSAGERLRRGLDNLLSSTLLEEETKMK